MELKGLGAQFLDEMAAVTLVLLLLMLLHLFSVFWG